MQSEQFRGRDIAAARLLESMQHNLLVRFRNRRVESGARRQSDKVDAEGRQE